MEPIPVSDQSNYMAKHLVLSFLMVAPFVYLAYYLASHGVDLTPGSGNRYHARSPIMLLFIPVIIYWLVASRKNIIIESGYLEVSNRFGKYQIAKYQIKEIKFKKIKKGYSVYQLDIKSNIRNCIFRFEGEKVCQNIMELLAKNNYTFVESN